MLSDNRPWWHRAACKDEDPNLFHPRRGGSPEPALAICSRCPVQAECLADALDEEAQDSADPTGVRGALTAKARRPLVRARRKATKRETATLTRIRRLAAAGMRCQDIGRELDMTPGSVSALCRGHGIELRAGGSGRRRKPQPAGGGVR